MKFAATASVLLIVAASCAERPRLRIEPVPIEEEVQAESAPTREQKQTSMLEVDGDYCDSVQEDCLKWGDAEKLRCLEFKKPTVCLGSTKHKHFFIDRFEFPNRAGELPKLMVTWEEAGDLCKKNGKRLCTSSEWVLACEGQERSPYPYGYTRDASACNIDHDTRGPNESAIGDPRTRDAEVARLDQRVPSGSMDRCVSPYGVQDMTGNVDEWVVNESGFKDKAPWESGLKGGYWGPVRTRCRPMTVAHNQKFAYYQIGFRCCSDVRRESTPSAP